MQKNFILLILSLTLSCRQMENRNKNYGTDGGKDTVLVDKFGNVLVGHFNEKTEEISNTINGNVIYSYSLNQGELTFDKNGNILKSVYKKEYMNDRIMIYINDDTLKIGETFFAVIWTDRDRYNIQLEQPVENL